VAGTGYPFPLPIPLPLPRPLPDSFTFPFPFPFPTGFLAARRVYPSSLSSTATLEGAPGTSRTRRGTR